MFRCAKRHVVVVVTGRSGETYIGTNGIRNSIETCPRGPNDDYTKCRMMCRQPAHAEINALAAAGDDASGGVLLIYGHDKMCDDCAEAVKKAGVVEVLYTL